MNIRSLLFAFLLLFCNLLLPNEIHPKLLLHFDMNGTITLGHKTNSETIINSLSDLYKDKWDPSIETPISYKTYVKKHLLVGKTKKEQQEKIYAFLTFLKETNHPLEKTIQEQYNHALVQLEHQNKHLFPSLYALLTYLDLNEYDFSIIIRTFGNEGDTIAQELESVTRKPFFTHQLYFKDGLLYLKGRDKQDSPINDLYTFLKENKNVLIHDDWARWAAHNEQVEFGKPFPINTKETNVCSFFFDDNIEEDCSTGTNIVAPIDVTTQKIIPIAPLLASHTIVHVNTLQALQDDSYYINFIQEKEQHAQ